MPYVIHPYKYGYRVYAEDGTPKSRLPLTMYMAKRQLAALYASMKRTGGSSNPLKDKEEDDEIREYPLSDGDLHKILPGLKIMTYPELNDMNSIEEAFDSQGRCMILYLTEDEHTGHWVCMIKKARTIEYFDPYGKYRPDEEGKWLSKEKRLELGEDFPTLTHLLRDSRYKVLVNPYHFQKDSSNISTCGRHCITRLYRKDLSLPQYKKLVDSSGMNPDDFVSSFTYDMIHK